MAMITYIANHGFHEMIVFVLTMLHNNSATNLKHFNKFIYCFCGSFLQHGIAGFSARGLTSLHYDCRPGLQSPVKLY